jgi:hypothetical protein
MGGDAAQQGPRPRVIGLSLAFAVIAVLLSYQVHVRVPVDYWVVRDEAQAYHQVGVKGKMMNVYSLFIENRSLRSGSYRLSVSGIKDAELVMPLNPVLVPPNSMMKINVYVLVKRKNLVYRVTRLRFMLEHTEARELRLTREAAFIYSDRSDKGLEI